MKTRKPAVATIDDRNAGEYDLLICALGYESRSRFIAETQDLRAKERLAIGFPRQQVLRFAENRHWFGRAGFEVAVVEDEQLRSRLDTALAMAKRDSRELRVCCDISSLSRLRIAMVVDAARSFSSVSKVRLDFLYAAPTFSPPPEPLFANGHVGPILPSFAGWTAEPELPVSAIVGLGYEPDKALGAVEHLQAGEVWTFEPVSAIAEFTQALHDANGTLLDFVPLERRLRYRLERPFTLFSALQSLAGSCLRSSNPVILPFGPKMFTLASLLVACRYTDLAVWRVSAGLHEIPVDREANGIVLGLSVDFTFEPEDGAS
jgi:hypothetical protein